MHENLTPEHKYYIAIAGLFNDFDRNIVELWPKYESLFKDIMKKDKAGLQHIWQAIILFFMNKYPSQQAKASEFCKVLYESEFYNAEFFKSYASG